MFEIMKRARWPWVVRRAVQPLASRKVRVALTTVLVAFAADYGLKVNTEIVLTILGVGVSLILGIAHEDAGRGAQRPERPPEQDALPQGEALSDDSS